MIPTERGTLLLDLVQEFQGRNLWFGETVAQEVLFLCQALGGPEHYRFRWDGWMPTCSDVIDDVNALRARRDLQFEPFDGVRGPTLHVRNLGAGSELAAQLADLYERWPYEPKLSLAAAVYLNRRREPKEFDRQITFQFPGLDPDRLRAEIARLPMLRGSQELQPV
ncbi:MAG: hypothetical protein HY319_26325 [Armatimonadetes bacterium]|nr:hypothetical protein [Armatimonadota bacterium]